MQSWTKFSNWSNIYLAQIKVKILENMLLKIRINKYIKVDFLNGFFLMSKQCCIAYATWGTFVFLKIIQVK